MNEEKKEQKIDLKDRMLSDDDLGQVSGGLDGPSYCMVMGHIWVHSVDSAGIPHVKCSRCGAGL